MNADLSSILASIITTQAPNVLILHIQEGEHTELPWTLKLSNDSEDIDVESDSNVYKMLKFACEISKNLFVNIKEYF